MAPAQANSLPAHKTYSREQPALLSGGPPNAFWEIEVEEDEALRGTCIRWKSKLKPLEKLTGPLTPQLCSQCSWKCVGQRRSRLLSLSDHTDSRSWSPGPLSKETLFSLCPPPSIHPTCYSSVSASCGEITANLSSISSIPPSLCESCDGCLSAGGGSWRKGVVDMFWGRSLGVWWVLGGVLGRALRDFWSMLRGFQVSLSSPSSLWRSPHHGLHVCLYARNIPDVALRTRVQDDQDLPQLLIGEECVDKGRSFVVHLSAKSLLLSLSLCWGKQSFYVHTNIVLTPNNQIKVIVHGYHTQ